jgi:hypothetical protein
MKMEDYKTAKSAWEFGKNRSSYHFDTKITDMRWDTVQGLGKFSGNWAEELEQQIADAVPVNIATRRNQWQRDRGIEHNKVKLHTAETNDFINVGADPEMTIFRVQHDLSPTFQKMVEAIGLEQNESRLHIQYPGEAFLGHVDRFDLNYPGVDQDDLMRIGIMLKDYEQGHFFQFGNHLYQHWRAGDIHTFDYRHVPHYTANSGLSPRVTLFTTGIITDKTRAFLKQARHATEIQI